MLYLLTQALPLYTKFSYKFVSLFKIFIANLYISEKSFSNLPIPVFSPSHLNHSPGFNW